MDIENGRRGKFKTEERTFCFSLFKMTKICFGSTKMEIFYREKAFYVGKKWLCPLRKIFLLRPCGRCTISHHFQLLGLSAMLFVVDTAVLRINMLIGLSMFQHSTLTTIDNRPIQKWAKFHCRQIVETKVYLLIKPINANLIIHVFKA